MSFTVIPPGAFAMAPPKRLLVYGTGRSGTTLLVRLLDQQHDIVCNAELLQRRIPNPLEVLQRHGTAAANRGVTAWGFKLLHHQLQRFMPTPAVADSAATASWMRSLVDEDFVVIRVRRDDLLRQALSGLQADLRNTYFTPRHQPWRYAPFEVDPDAVVKRIRFLEREDQAEHETLEDIDHLLVQYEHDLCNLADQHRTVHRICGRLGIRTTPVLAPIRKQLPEPIEEIITNPDAVMAALVDAGYDGLIDHTLDHGD